MKILITGSTGQLGNELINVIKNKGTSIGKIDDIYNDIDLITTNSSQLDVTYCEAVRKFILTKKPDIIINTAAYTNVDACEKNYQDAFKVNSLGPRNLAIVAEEINAKLVHISTDYVFSGESEVEYREFDNPSPINIYGKTKLLGEKYIREFCSKYFIVRTSWLYGLYGKNFVKTIIELANKNDALEVVNDQIGSPTYAEDLAYHILKIVLTEEYGIYHCTGNGRCSWFDFAKKIVQYADITCKVDSINSKKLNKPAKRPSYSLLDNMMLRCTVNDEMRNWQDALKDFIIKYIKEQ